MGELSQQVAHFARSLVARKAGEQGGVISGDNPSQYNQLDPLRLWVIQVVIIIAMTQFLASILGRIRQPRVIAEVIGGIILGPTVMGRIPGFKQAIFPDLSIQGLTLTSTIGLILFLFLVGLEIDTKVIKRQVLSASTISIAGLILPLGLGAALGIGIFNEFIRPINPDVNFGYFLLFTAVAIGITAFPVLCRILTELKLLDTTVGVVTLAAGVGNDVVGWIMLALTVALVNASTGLTALYVLLACVGFIILLLYPGRWGYVWLARRTGSLEQGSPTPGMMTITILVVFASAFFTDIIGVHAIFGGFLAGLIIPHENGYAISLVEKLEDLVNILFLPIYFTLSGLKTNLGLLDNGKTWGWTIIICLVAFCSKFFACYGAAKATGFNWRESGAIGALMSCKGLVELIVLNIGLAANILDTRTFSMFVVHALILTFITTPLTLLFYPPKYRMRDTPEHHIAEVGVGPRSSSEGDAKTRFALVLDKIEQLPAAMTISQLLQPNRSFSSTTTLTTINEKEKIPDSPPPFVHGQISINALRLIELTSRTSAVLKSKVAETLIYNDPVVSVFRTFGYLNHLLVSAALSVVNHDEFSDAIAKHVIESESQMVIIPWSRGTTSVVEDDQAHNGASNPFDGIFHRTTTQDQTSSVVYSEFIRNVFATAPSHVALFVDRGLSTPYTGATSSQHLFLPFFGGPDDRLALSFLVQLCQNTSVEATVVRIQKLDALSRASTNIDAKEIMPSTPISVTLPQHGTLAAADTVYGQHNTETRLASDTADNMTWNRYASSSASQDVNTAMALNRITFSSVSSAKPLHTIVELVASETSKSTPAKNVIVITGRSRRMAAESHTSELQQIITESGAPVGSSVSKTLGDVGAALVASNTAASLLILQAFSSA